VTSAERIARARHKAKALQRRLGVTYARQIDIDEVADRMSVQIVDAPLEGALAQLIVNGRSARILLSTRLRDPARRRFAIAHELGHYVLSHPSMALAEFGEPRPCPASSNIEACDVEREADSFALELLMPAAEVDALCEGRDPDLSLAGRLAFAATVPTEHAAVRIVERSDRVCAAVLTVPAGISSVTASELFARAFECPLTSSLPESAALDPRALASQIREGSVPRRSTAMPTQAWLGVPRPPLLESSVALDDGSILTMLWAPRIEGAMGSTRSVATAH
jgi:hypothetical protein